MHNTQRQQQLTNEAATATESLLDAIMEVGVRKPDATEAISAFAGAGNVLGLIADLDAAAPAGKYSRGRRIVMRGDVQVVRQDSDSLCQGGLFGSVDESEEPVRALHATQIPMDAVEVERSKGCCICGDGRCGIGPFIIRKEGK